MGGRFNDGDKESENFSLRKGYGPGNRVAVQRRRGEL